jgi:NADPH:quinone reductase-like Zn-dependent oxidoreductase
VREISPDGVDAVFDHVGGPGLVDSWRMLRRGGTLVSYGSASTLGDSGHRLRPYLPTLGRILLWSALPDGKRATFYHVKRRPKLFREDLVQVLPLLAEGKIEARVESRPRP